MYRILGNIIIIIFYAQDSGKYFCLLNKEAKPRVVYNLAIQVCTSKYF